MKIFKRKQPPPQEKVNEDEIQNEIRRRILKEAQTREGTQNAQDATQATLDALEQMVPLSREEMERIADEVRAEYQNQKPDSEKPGVVSRVFPWLTILLVVTTFFLLRRGSSWVLISGLILLFALLNILREKFPTIPKLY